MFPDYNFKNNILNFKDHKYCQFLLDSLLIII